ncbi:MAG: hypothetical protein AAF085_03385, partial [Planctomycetota bacterium]
MRSWTLLISACLLGAGSSAPVSADEDHLTNEPVCATDFASPDELGLYNRLTRNKLVKVVDDEGVGGSEALQVTYRGYRRGSERIIQSFK